MYYVRVSFIVKNAGVDLLVFSFQGNKSALSFLGLQVL